MGVRARGTTSAFRLDDPAWLIDHETTGLRHPSIPGLARYDVPDRWDSSDELYDFQPHPCIRNRGRLMGDDHPAHDSMRMIIEGVRWAGGRGGLQGCQNEGGDD
jgi:hypothetical protein